LHFIDTHCHLFFTDFDADREAVIQRAIEAGVTKMIVPATTPENVPQAIALAEKYENIYVAIGYHPYEAHTLTDADFDLLEKNISHPKVVAVGETGLDFHRDGSEVEKQTVSFRKHIELAKKYNLPLIVHCRAAKDAVWNELKDSGARFVIHCFSEDFEFAQQLIAIDGMMSFTGIVTYETSKRIRQVAREADLSHIMIETDCPYLKPGVRSDARCEPADVVAIAQEIADLRGISLQQVADQTTKNAEKFFRLT
jgi:TatD DNase family protein